MTPTQSGKRPAICTAIAILPTIILLPCVALADSGGVSFWVPGNFGSMAAVPPTPGWSFAEYYYHSSVGAAGKVPDARAIRIGTFTGIEHVTVNGSLHSPTDLLYVAPSYAFATPVLGGQAAVSVAGAYGRTSTALNGTVTGVAPVSFTQSDNRSDSLVGFADLSPQFSLAWKEGVHNLMTYVTGNLPVGAFDATRLSNLGIGFWAIDSGVGYTYYDKKTGHEFSAVAGLTYNFINPAIEYQNGIDWHFDWAASQFLSEHLQVGLAGYFYNQITGDGGAGDKVGSFMSRVTGIGPQILFLFPVSGLPGSLNLKLYEEFDAQNRPDGWNAWVTFSISPSPISQPSGRTHL
jgi:hypothetical protein